ncbi:MAG TPA: transcription termination factor NusA [Candidatus Megaira endosymbiont of Hartmannula sinica]|nr:transcription termination factor NusA [Candidatus Megaera endosymbiont of Hartmannula sinica]
MQNIQIDEIIQAIEIITQEKQISKQADIKIAEDAITAAALKKYGMGNVIRTDIELSPPKISINRVITIVEEVENHSSEISLQDAKLYNENASIGEEILQPLPTVIDDIRTSIGRARYTIRQGMSKEDKKNEYEEYKNKQGDIINGKIKRIERGGTIIVDVNGAEAILRRIDQIKSENYQTGDRITAYIREVRLDFEDYQIILSRSDEAFLEKIITQNILQIFKNEDIIVKNIARIAGVKSKIALFSKDRDIDVVGYCVGPKGSRIKPIMQELSGEKIDVIAWSDDIKEFVRNAIYPATVIDFASLDQINKTLKIIVPEDQISIAIGKAGQNINLTSRITGYRIDVITHTQQSKQIQEEISSYTNLITNEIGIDQAKAEILYSKGFHNIDSLVESSQENIEQIEGFSSEEAARIREGARAYINKRLVETLDVDDLMANTLIDNGFYSAESILSSNDGTIENIEGFNDDLVEELKNRANFAINHEHGAIVEELEKLGVDQEIIDMFYDLEPRYILKMARFGIKTLEDVRATSVYEFTKIIPKSAMDRERIKEIIKISEERK